MFWEISVFFRSLLDVVVLKLKTIAAHTLAAVRFDVDWERPDALTNVVHDGDSKEEEQGGGEGRDLAGAADEIRR